MRVVSLIDQEDVIERILRHLGICKRGRIPDTDSPGETTSVRGSTTRSPTTNTEPVIAFSAS